MINVVCSWVCLHGIFYHCNSMSFYCSDELYSIFMKRHLNDDSFYAHFFAQWIHVFILKKKLWTMQQKEMTIFLINVLVCWIFWWTMLKFTASWLGKQRLQDHIEYRSGHCLVHECWSRLSDINSDLHLCKVRTLIKFMDFAGRCFSDMACYAGVNYSSPTLSTAMLNLVPAFAYILAIIFR